MSQNEALAQRQQFFKSVDLYKDLIGCGDDRSDLAISLFGGAAANTATSLMVLKEASEPGSVQTPYEDQVANVIPELQELSVSVIVHSDEKTEGGLEFDSHKSDEEGLGCAYILLRQAINQLIAQNVEVITEKLAEQKPHLYNSAEGRAKIAKFIGVFGKLGERDELYTSGRATAKKAIEQGAEAIVLPGAHVASVGFLNGERDESLAKGVAMEAGLPAYNHDTWAAKDIYHGLKPKYGFEESDYETVNDIDAVGTMLALKLEEIIAR